MARKRTRLMTLFSLVAVLALAGMGLTYTLWSETETIDGTVSTGEVDVEIAVSVPAHDNEIPTKNTATCDAQTSLSNPNDGSDGNNQLQVTVGGAYPSYECMFEFRVNNIGTVPVHFAFSNMNFPTWMVDNIDSDTNTPDNELVCYQSESGGAETLVTSLAALDATGQIHTGGYVRCDVTIHFTNADLVAENLGGVGGAPITFSLDIQAHQYNESVSSS